MPPINRRAEHETLTEWLIQLRLYGMYLIEMKKQMLRYVRAAIKTENDSLLIAD